MMEVDDPTDEIDNLPCLPAKEPWHLETYCRQRVSDLYNFHPQWSYTTDEIVKCEALLKRDLTPICIPPSLDLIQKYAGPHDSSADGYIGPDEEGPNGVILKAGVTKQQTITGDRSEQEFFNIMRNMEIGGILIGNIDSKDLKNEWTFSSSGIPYTLPYLFWKPFEVKGAKGAKGAKGIKGTNFF